jgi:hypothetical protein
MMTKKWSSIAFVLLSLFMVSGLWMCAAASQGEPDLALAKAGAKATVDSCFTGYKASPLIDGERNDRSEEGRWDKVAWASQESKTEHWAIITFPKLTSIHQVDIYWAHDRGIYYTSAKYSIQYWKDTQWVDLYTEQNSKSNTSKSSQAFSPVETEKVRIIQPVEGGSASPVKRENIMWVAEIEIY